jgi:hypothetical protein
MAATTAAIAGLAISGISAGMSFAQAIKANRAMNDANKEAELALQEAKKRLEVNVYDQLSVYDRPFIEAQEQARGQALQQIIAGQEADQGAVATAGKLQQAQNEQQNQIAMAHGMKLEELEKLSATEQGRLLDVGAQIDLSTAEGAQQAAADAQRQKAQSIQQGFQMVGQGIQYGAQLVPLYMQTQAGKKLDMQMSDYNQSMKSGTLPNQYKKPDGSYMTYQEAVGMFNPAVLGMTPTQYSEYNMGLNKRQVMANNPLSYQNTEATRYQPFSINIPDLGQGFDWTKGRG